MSLVSSSTLSPLFQFHKGTIKTYDNENIPYLVNTFQFHKGTIKTVTTEIVALFNSNFNSIKVRLKPSMVPHHFWVS